MRRVDKIAIILELIKDENKAYKFSESIGIAIHILRDDQIDGLFLHNVQKHINKLEMTEDRSRMALLCLVEFELDMDHVSIPASELHKIDELISVYEKEEKYELCVKLQKYKTKVQEKCLI